MRHTQNCHTIYTKFSNISLNSPWQNVYKAASTFETDVWEIPHLIIRQPDVVIDHWKISNLKMEKYCFIGLALLIKTINAIIDLEQTFQMHILCFDSAVNLCMYECYVKHIMNTGILWTGNVLKWYLEKLREVWLRVTQQRFSLLGPNEKNKCVYEKRICLFGVMFIIANF